MLRTVRKKVKLKKNSGVPFNQKDVKLNVSVVEGGPDSYFDIVDNSTPAAPNHDCSFEASVSLEWLMFIIVVIIVKIWKWSGINILGFSNRPTFKLLLWRHIALAENGVRLTVFFPEQISFCFSSRRIDINQTYLKRHNRVCIIDLISFNAFYVKRRWIASFADVVM